MTMIWTAQYRYRGPDRIDITTKKTHPIGKWFAPDWATMVGPYRNGWIDEKEYTKRYMSHMRDNFVTNPSAFRWVLTQLEVTLVCFCKPDAFCHRVILARDIFATSSIAKAFNVPQAIYKGERVPSERQTKLF